MADRVKDVTCEVDGKTLTLRNTLGTLKRFQRRFDTVDDKGRARIADLMEVQRFLAEGSLEHQIAFIWAALQDHHAAEFPTIESVDDLYERHEYVIGAAFLQLVGAGKYDPKDLEELARRQREGNPPEAQTATADGTGESSNLPVSPAA